MHVRIAKIMIRTVTLTLVLWLGCFSAMNVSRYVLLSEDHASIASNPNEDFSSQSLGVTRIGEIPSTTVRDYWPTTGWRYSSAEEQGMNSTKLEEMMEYIRSEGFLIDSVVIARNGYIVLEEYPTGMYGQNTSHLLYSATKSVTSMLIGIALSEGYIDNAQHKLVDFFPNRNIANMSSQKQAITLENVLTMSSGLQWDEWTYPPYDPRNSVTRMTQTYDWVQYVLDQPMAHDPGTVWTYCGGGSHLLSAVLNETTGSIAELYAREKLFHPLGITQEYWMTDYTGLTLGYTHLYLRPLDMAKLGFLYLNNGAWDGEQIVPAEWVNTSTQALYRIYPDFDYYYGYQWWIHPSTGYYFANGWGGQVIAVVPDYDMVIVFTGSDFVYEPTDHLINDFILPSATTPPIVVPNDFPMIQEAINNAVEGDTVLVKSGTYYEHVVVNKTVSLVGEDRGTTVVDGNMTGPVVLVTANGANLTGFTIRASQNTHPICDVWLENVSQCNIRENTFTDSFYGVYLNESDDNSIRANHATNLSIGICGFESDGNLFSGNEFVANSFASINLHLCRFNNITENLVSGSSTGVRLLDGAENNTVLGNTIIGNLRGIHIFNARYNEICNNMIAHNCGPDEWDAGVRLESAAYTRIHDNEITDNQRGIVLYASSPYVSICRNNVTINDFGIRVAMGGSNYVSILDNYVADNRGYGIDVTGFGGVGESNYATIARNLIVNNTFEAVGLGIGSSYNTVVQNDMIGNGHAGVTLERYSNYNTIVENNIIGNAYGICFDLYEVNSTQNMVLNNSIVNNTQQVRIAPGSINAWNGTYPYGGNYWSDHFSWDIFSGPYQNETGSDGIGDAPYIIDENNIDHYPHVPYRLPADVNNDGYVGIDDIFLIASNFGKEKGQPGWDPLYDIDSDYCVNVTDIFFAARHFGLSSDGPVLL